MKARFVSMMLGLLPLLLVGTYQAQEKAAPPQSPEQAAIQVRQAAIEAQKDLARRFADFQKNLQILKTRLDRSPNDQDKRRAAQLQVVLDKADSDDIRNKFVRLQNHLAKKDFDVNEYQEAARMTEELARDLAKLVDMFELNDSQLQKDLKEAKDVLEMVNRILKEEYRLKDLTEQERTEKKDLSKQQADVAQGTKTLKEVVEEKAGIKKSPMTPPQGAEAKDPKSEAKEGKGDANKSESRDTGKKTEAAEAKDKGSKEGKQAKEEKPGEAKGKNDKLPELKPALPKSGEKKDPAKGSENKEANAKEAKGGKDNQAQAKEAKGNESKQATPKEAGAKDKNGNPQAPKEAGEAKDNAKGSEKEQPKTGDNKNNPKAKGSENKEANAKDSKGPKDGQSQAKEAKGGDNKQATPKEAGAKDKNGNPEKAKEAGEAKDNSKGNEKKEQPKDNVKEAQSKDKGPDSKEANAKDSKSNPDSKADTKDAPKDSKQAEAKSSDSKPGQKSNAKSPPMDGQDKDAPPPQAKDGGDKSPPPPPNQADNDENNPTKKKIQDIDYAIKKMQEAKTKIEQDDNKGAADDQAKAIDKLETLKKELEKRLKIMREEELERLLANLKARCERMLAMQIDVLSGPRGTELTHRAIQSNPDKKPSSDNVQASLALGEKEKEIITEATKAIEVLENEGSAVAVHSAFVTVREDMRQVHRRLSPEAGRQIDVGKLTQRMEEDIIEQLKEMIAVFDKKKEEMDKKKKDEKKKPPQPPTDKDKGPQPDPKLLDTIQELKMIRSMQVRLNKRTQDIAESLPPGQEQQQPADPNVRREIEELRERQDRIADITNKIQKGDNK